MSRKKTAKRSAKRQLTSNSSTMQRMEMDFLNTPSKLSAQLNKEIKTLKQRESKLKASLSKNKSQIKTSEGRIKIAKGKGTALSKKQLTKFKKSHGLLLKDHTDLSKQLNEANKSLTTATDKQLKLTALRKQLTQFEKDWSAQKKAKMTAKNRVKPKTTRKTRSSAPRIPSPAQPFQQPTEAERFESSINERIDETSETTS